MSSVTVNISFQDQLLSEIDAEAKRESRSRSELIREAARLYVQRQRRWDDAFALGDNLTASRSLKPADVSRAIRDVRKRRQTTK